MTPSCASAAVDAPNDSGRLWSVTAAVPLCTRAITADTDLRLCRCFGRSNGYWLRGQVACDTEIAARTLGPVLRRLNLWAGAAA